MFCILNSGRTPKQNMYGNEISSSFGLLAQYKTLTRLVEHKLEHLIAEGVGNHRSNNIKNQRKQFLYFLVFLFGYIKDVFVIQRCSTSVIFGKR